MRILVVSQFWPGPADPDLGVFVRQVTDELAAAGTRSRGRSSTAAGRAGRATPAWPPTRCGSPRAGAPTSSSPTSSPPPASPGRWRASPGARRSSSWPTARTCATCASRPVRAATALVVRRADGVIANSAYLAGQLAARLPAAAAKTTVVDCGVDLDAFAPRDQAAARARLGLPAGLEAPVFTFVGGLHERKNVVRLRDALDRGTLLVVGDGPLRGQLEGHPRIRLAGAVPHAHVPDWIAAGDALVLPSVEEPLGQVVLEALAGARSVVATRVGGPPEFVTPAAGALVDPLDVAAIRAGLHRAAALPVPNPAARAAAEPHALPRQVDRMEALLAAAAARSTAAPSSASSTSSS
jgi:glycosyltransferase involved in cell wall biosynthesis